MSDFETPQNDLLEFGKHIPGLDPAYLEVDNYLNLETESGSRYVFRVTAKNEDGIFIERISGSDKRKGISGKLSKDRIKLDGVFDFQGGSISDLAGIVLTREVPHQYTTPILQYNKYLEELDARQLEPGTYLYLAAEDGLTYIAEVLENDGEKPKVMFVAGKNKSTGMEGEIKILDFRLGMRFRNTARSTMPIKAMLVRPDLNTDMLAELEKKYSLSEVEYDQEIDKLLIAQMQHDDYVIITTVNSTYVLEIERVDENRIIFEIVGGDSNYVGDKGFFLQGKIRRKRSFKYSNARESLATSPIKSIKVTKHYGPSEYDVDVMRADLESQQHAVMSRSGEHTNPGLWIAVTTGEYEQKFFDLLKLDPRALRVGDLQAAWANFEKEHGPASRSRNSLAPHKREEKAGWYNAIKKKYEALLKTAKDVNK